MVVTLEEAKKWVKVEHGEDDDLIAMLLEAAENAAETYCMKSFGDAPPAIVRLAIRIYVTNFYDNRASEEKLNWESTRNAWEHMLHPHRDPAKLV